MKTTNILTGMVVALIVCACSPLYAAPSITADTFLSADYVQCANGRTGYKKCPAGEETADPATLPLATMSNFTYAGAFRVPASVDQRTTAASKGKIGLSVTSGNFYMSRHSTTLQGISEMTIPALSTSTDINALNFAAMVQQRLDVFNPPNGNLQDNDRVSGIYALGGTVIVTQAEFYDATGSNTDMAIRASNPTDFSSPQMGGYYEIEGAYKSSAWMSEIPSVWQVILGYTHIIGNASNFAINSRASMGPSAYGIDMANLTVTTPTEPIPTFPFQSYDITAGQQLQQQVDPLYDLFNTSGNNAIWTYQSTSGYGFIVPGTRTYAVFGTNGGMVSGVQYKGTNQQGTACGGYCETDATDWSHHIWFYDVNDLVAVMGGSMQPYEVIPYAYQQIDTTFELERGATIKTEIGGGMFDYDAGRLYLSVIDADLVGSIPRPVIIAYDLGGL